MGIAHPRAVDRLAWLPYTGGMVIPLRNVRMFRAFLPSCLCAVCLLPAGGAEPASAPVSAPATAPASVSTPEPALGEAHETFGQDSLSPYDPIYFAVGDDSKREARFQISFKYHFFKAGRESDPALTSPLRNLYFGYTQTSIWDLGVQSSPFYDTAYKPALFYLHDALWGEPGAWHAGVRTGIEHESNGKSGPTSRAINTIFVEPQVTWWPDDWYRLRFAPKAYVYLTRIGNPHIQEYRGFIDWQLRWGNRHTFELTTLARLGTDGRGSVLCEGSFPVERILPFRESGYLFAQWFSGYGETILDDDRFDGSQFRVGFMIVR